MAEEKKANYGSGHFSFTYCHQLRLPVGYTSTGVVLQLASELSPV
jgi:hypothetical protein